MKFRTIWKRATPLGNFWNNIHKGHVGRAMQDLTVARGERQLRRSFESRTSIGKKWKQIYRSVGGGSSAPVSSATGLSSETPYGYTGSIVGKY